MNFQIPNVDSEVLSHLHSPSVLVFADCVRSNIERMVEVAGATDRLRPHCKTHKMSAIIEMLLTRGVRQHKAATIAEVEMLADAGVRDIVFAYNPVGPNIDRVVAILQKFDRLTLAVTADAEMPVRCLSDAAARVGVSVGVMLDTDVGLHRTGVSADSDRALSLYTLIAELPGLTLAGFHVYDGHQHQNSLEDRRAAVLAEWQKVVALKQACESEGLAVPEILCGGTPTFPVYAGLEDPVIRLSPGTGIFHDVGYGGNFPDLGFNPAAVVVTRVVSRPTSSRVTLDLGNKSVAADPPKGHRVYFPDLPNAAQVIHNEEHLVLETEDAHRFEPGDVLLGIPTHICPTSALHQEVAVIENGQLSTPWTVTARNRRITI